MRLPFETQTLSLGHGASHHFDSMLFTATRRFAFTSGAGTLRTDLARIGDAGLRISRVVSTGHEIELSETEHATFLTPRTGRLDVDLGRKTWRAEAGRLLAFRPTDRLTRASAEGAVRFEAHVVMLFERRLAMLRGDADRADRRRATDAARFGGAAARRLAAYLGFLFDDVLAPGGADLQPATQDRIAALLEDLVAEVAAGWGGATEPKPAALRRVRLAEEIMRARAHEPLAIHDVARDLGVGLRSLQLAFRSARGEEPRATLTRIRLERARVRLRTAAEGETVTSVALDCGFTHLGRFALAYRAAFGERPSDTLARRR